MRNRIFPFIVFLLLTSALWAAHPPLQMECGVFQLYCRENDVPFVKQALGWILEASPLISLDLGLVMTDTVRIIVAANPEQFQEVTGHRIPEWGVGAANGSQRTIFLQSPSFAKPELDLKRIVVHEFSHICLYLATGRSVARWFDEGLAMWESGEIKWGGSVVMARAVFGKNLIPLGAIESVLDFNRDQAALAYLESREAVDFLFESYGRDVIRLIVASLAAGKSMDQALMETIGAGYAEFQKDLFKNIRHKYGWYLILDFPFVLSLVFILLFMVAVTAKYIQKRRKHKAWDLITETNENTLEENSL